MENALKGELLETVFDVEGMTCASCSARVEKALNSTAGVTVAAVNLATERARVSFDPLRVRTADLFAAVEKAGYRAREPVDETAAVEEKREARQSAVRRTRLLIAAVFTVPLVYIAMSPMIIFLRLPVLSFLDPMDYPLRFAWIQLLLALPVLAAGFSFYRHGIPALLRGGPNMDSLIAVGTLAAMIYSVSSLVQIAGGNLIRVRQLYFETSAVIITLILLGKSLEAGSKNRAKAAIRRLVKLRPETAVVMFNGEERELPLRDVVVGDLVRVQPGQRMPLDGTVVDGYTAADESMLTGESIPVEKAIGATVVGGSLNTTGTILFRVDAVGDATVLSSIIKLVEEAQGTKAPIARLADIVSGYFVPIVMVIAVLAGLGWLAAGKDLSFAVNVFTTILVIACPCALGLATPIAIMVGTGRGAELGILIKGGPPLELLKSVDTVVFDKTGTITLGRPKVTDVVAANPEQVLRLAASAEKNSEHPLAAAVLEAAAQKAFALSPATDFIARPGFGIIAKIDDARVLVGNRELLETEGVDPGEGDKDAGRLLESGRTVLYVAIGGLFSGLIACADTIKSGAASAVADLHRLGISTVLLTGDNERAARAVAAEAGIDIVVAGVKPDGKVAEIERLQSSGKRVAMVGDGINDGPALVRADVGIAIGSGTDVAVEAADIVLTRDDPADVARAVRLSRATIRNIKQNLFWAFIYNIAGIPVAAGLLTLFGGRLLDPVFAAAAMSLSSVSVVTNALRLRRFDRFIFTKTKEV